MPTNSLKDSRVKSALSKKGIDSKQLPNLKDADLEKYLSQAKTDDPRIKKAIFDRATSVMAVEVSKYQEKQRIPRQAFLQDFVQNQLQASSEEDAINKLASTMRNSEKFDNLLLTADEKKEGKRVNQGLPDDKLMMQGRYDSFFNNSISKEGFDKKFNEHKDNSIFITSSVNSLTGLQPLILAKLIDELSAKVDYTPPKEVVEKIKATALNSLNNDRVPSAKNAPEVANNLTWQQCRAYFIELTRQAAERVAKEEKPKAFTHAQSAPAIMNAYKLASETKTEEKDPTVASTSKNEPPKMH